MSAKVNVSRRDFLRVIPVVGMGLLIEVSLQGCGRKPGQGPQTAPESTAVEATAVSSGEGGGPAAGATKAPNLAPIDESGVSPNLYVKIGYDGQVTITVPRSELGQGTRTALAMIAAEELCAEWSTVRIEQAPGDAAYGDQVTGGSTSIQVFYDRLGRAGAVGRELMVRAAARTWEVDSATCYAENNQVVHQPTGRRLAYIDLLDSAGQIEVPRSGEVKLKKPEEFKIIGTNIGRYDNPQIITGKAVFGSDVRLPGMLYATVVRSPVLGGKVEMFDLSAAEKVPGVRSVVPIDCGVAVVAENTWAAIQGQNALEVTWEKGAQNIDSAQIEQELLDKANSQKAGDNELVAVYSFPYFAHITMEPMNCTVDARDDRCEVWVPTQNPQPLVSKAARLAGTTSDKTRVNVTLSGGAFGRRLELSPHNIVPPEVDYTAQAVQISKAVGAPVHVFWTREDDIRHDLFHPISAYRVTARLDDIKSLRSQRFESQASIPVGYWRSVTNPPDAFAHECFVDEYAAATKIDPVELRRKMYENDPRALGVINLAAEKAGWGDALPAGRGRGFAYHSTWGVTGVAEVVEVTVESGELRVDRVVCVVDCGLAVNPEMVVAQMESGIVFGLTAVLKENIRIEEGRVVQSNFHDYPILRADEMPVIEVFLVPSEQSPSGVGEMANPPLAPAVANAVFAATGKRIRRIPIRPEDLA